MVETELQRGREEQGVKNEKAAPEQGGRGQGQGRFDQQGIGKHSGQGADIGPGENAIAAAPRRVRKQLMAKGGGGGEQQEREGYVPGEPPEQVQNRAVENLRRKGGWHQGQGRREQY
jgi:hypothetical protein